MSGNAGKPQTAPISTLHAAFRRPRSPSVAANLAAFAVVSTLLVAGCASSAGSPHASRSPDAHGSRTGPKAFEAAFSPEQASRIRAAQPHVAAAAAEYELDPNLINAVIWVESRFVTDAKSPAGARGLMQLMPATAAGLAKQLGEKRPRSYDPAFNVKAGSYYLRRLLDRFDGDLELALASYNAGAGNVNKWISSGKGLPDFSKDYVAKVFEARARFEGTPVPEVDTPPVAAPAATPEPAPEPRLAPMPANYAAATLDDAPSAEPEPEVPVAPAAPTLPVQADGPEPVFEPHPELDAHPIAPEPEPEPEPSGDVQEPAPPGDVQEPAPDSPSVGAGVLPGVGD